MEKHEGLFVQNSSDCSSKVNYTVTVVESVEVHHKDNNCVQSWFLIRAEKQLPDYLSKNRELWRPRHPGS